MENLNSFVNLYSVEKTLRFELKPVFKTTEFINQWLLNLENESEEKGNLLKKDIIRREKYEKIKKIIDEYHCNFIENVLKNVTLDYNKLNDYYILYTNKNKTDEMNKEFEKVKKYLREQISNFFSKSDDEQIKKIWNNLFSMDLIKKVMKKWIDENKEYLLKKINDIKDEKELYDLISEFEKFTTYLRGFHESRKNLYSKEDKFSTIAHRHIHENLPKFLDNIKIFKKVKDSEINLKEVEDELQLSFYDLNLNKIFSLEYFSKVLTQSGIDFYNYIIGGKTEENGKKIKGLNEFINLHNQKQSEKKNKLPRLKELYKLPLFERTSSSYKYKPIENDKELIERISFYYYDLLQHTDASGKTINILENLKDLLFKISNYSEGLYINGTTLSQISQKIFGRWDYIKNALSFYYDKNIDPVKLDKKGNPKKRKKTKEEKKENWLKQKEFPVKLVEDALLLYKEHEKNEELKNKITEYTICDFFKKLGEDRNGQNIFQRIKTKFEEKNENNDSIKDLLNINIIHTEKQLIQDKSKTLLIKNFLDLLLGDKEDITAGLFHFVKALIPKKNVSNKNETFYSELEYYYNVLSEIIPLYNKARNYLTQKPFSIDKIKLTFDNSQLLAGWDKNKESANTCILLRKKVNGLYMYYLGILNKKYNRALSDENTNIENLQRMIIEKNKELEDLKQKLRINEQGTNIYENNKNKINDLEKEIAFMKKSITLLNDTNNVYEKMIYKFLPTPAKELPKVFFSNSRENEFMPSEEILRIYNGKTFKKDKNNVFNKTHCHKLIDFFKESINKHKDWKNFNFKFKETHYYEDISQFYKEVETQGYKVTFVNISESFVHTLVNEGKLYLFKIYNKDFSENKKGKGKDNLHTIYWKMLFDERNLKDVVLKLNGQAEVFFRPKSLSYSEDIWQKGYHYEVLKNKFNYPIIKDKRYAQDKFFFHVPITLNFKSSGNEKINKNVNEWLIKNPDVHIIGIDRGERNLLYVSVINSKGEIVEQNSLNTIITEYDKKTFSVNYHELLDKREQERDKARKDWKVVEKIKELKQGYLSHVIHKISQLILKYKAIVVMEDLNTGFKRGRQKVEKQVYQNFEKMLIKKLNYLVLKDKNPEEPGGVLRALQLTNKFESFKNLDKQCGIIFYVPAAYTSKIDPVTGYIQFLFPLKEADSIEKARLFYSKFKSICYNKQMQWFEFTFNYNDFDIRYEGNPEWKICTTNTERYVWNKTLNNNKGGQELIMVTDELKKLFNDYNIPFEYGQNIKDIIANVNDLNHEKTAKNFFYKLNLLLHLTLSLRHNNGKKGSEEQDYILSPVEPFFDSRIESSKNIIQQKLPIDADANGAYNIARKGMILIKRLKEQGIDKFEASKKSKKNKSQWLTHEEWVKFSQASI